jgi:hypothetical protein
MNRTIE